MRITATLVLDVALNTDTNTDDPAARSLSVLKAQTF